MGEKKCNSLRREKWLFIAREREKKRDMSASAFTRAAVSSEKFHCIIFMEHLAGYALYYIEKHLVQQQPREQTGYGYTGTVSYILTL